jgi:hypothetical protein
MADARMSDRGYTDQPFTAAVCMRCYGEPEPLLMWLLRGVVRRCPHGLLVTTDCLLGEFTCASTGPNRGPIVLLQPCTGDRAPSGAVIWVGPVDTDADAKVVAQWVASGKWDRAKLPKRLQADLNLARAGHQN